MTEREELRRSADYWGAWVRARSTSLAAGIRVDPSGERVMFTPGALTELRAGIEALDPNQRAYALTAALVAVAVSRIPPSYPQAS